MPEVSDSFNHCSRIALNHYENFPVGSWLIPGEKRKYVHAVYAFARTADDFADEAGYAEDERARLLTDWEKRLDECMTGNPVHPVFVSLKEAIGKFHIPDRLLRDLITAFRMDIVTKRYKTMQDVLNYCRYSANPVGRIVLSIFEYKDPELHRLSDFICTALQLTNFWQDIATDLEKDRIYIPLEDMERYGYSVNDLKSHTLNQQFRKMLAGEIAFTKDLFRSGLPLCTSVKKGLSVELRAICSGGMKILEKIEQNGYDVFNKRPVITKLDKIWIVLRALTSGH
ncbi:MAG: squalene synthase HpnC [Nitrospirae bacterium]|nr:squalene synthase HpnC [Nitrospirota bacterium]